VPGQRDGGPYKPVRSARLRQSTGVVGKALPRSRATGLASLRSAKQLVEQRLARCSFLRCEGAGSASQSLTPRRPSAPELTLGSS